MPTTKSTLFAVSKDKWDTNKGGDLYVHEECTGKAKGTSQAEATSNSKKFKPVVALAIVTLRESEGISKSVRQAVTQ